MTQTKNSADSVKSVSLDIRDAFFNRLYDIARSDGNVMFLTADMGALSLEKFKTDLPGQYINVGVAEQNLVSVAAGLSLAGKRVFIYAIAPFITQRCYEQIKVDLCGMRLPVTIIGVGAGITYGSDGATHHAIQDVANISALPNVTILNPCDAFGAIAAADEGYRSAGPVYVRLDKGNPPMLYKDRQQCDAGVAEILTGRDITIIATGFMTHRALEVAELLADTSVDAGVLDVYRLKPLNKQFLTQLCMDYRGIVVLEEHVNDGGLGSMVDRILLENGLGNIPRRWFGLMEESVNGYGSREWMHRAHKLDAPALCSSISQWVQTSKIKTFNNSAGNISRQRDDGGYCLDADDLASLLGISRDEVPARCLEELKKHDYSYRLVEGAERDEIILGTLEKIDAGGLSVAGEKKHPLWEKGWSENLQKFLSNKGDLEKLIPAYYRPGQVCRFRGMFVQGKDPQFEFNVFRLIRSWVLSVLLKDAPAVYEFGCGPGHNLVAMAQQFPDKRLLGLDWAASAVELVNNIAQQYGFNLTGRLFDLFNPDDSLHLEKGAAAVTFGALEQLGDGFEAFLQYLLRQKPAVCINVEPLVDLYDKDNLVDYIAVKHHKVRNLLQGYLPRLKQLDEQGRIRIERVQRVSFGGMFIEGWSYVVWRPYNS